MSTSTNLTTRQANFIAAYTDCHSPTFSNAYQSARAAGYSDLTARNITHVRPAWFSETIGQTAAINPEEIMKELSRIIRNPVEPTIVRLKTLELAMKAHNMFTRSSAKPAIVEINVDLTA